MFLKGHTVSQGKTDPEQSVFKIDFEGKISQLLQPDKKIRSLKRGKNLENFNGKIQC